MGKAEAGTPKDIAKRMKAKGLQKLKFYCQMCQKQCRDENGFKCHLTSESHLRQMKVFSENAHGLLDQFSSQFEKVYLDNLRRRHGTKKMNANNVYQEVIQDRHHIHMNATKWTSLSAFVQYLGKTGKCVVEETERGWYVTYIERDPRLLERQEAHERRVQAELRQEELQQKKRAKMRLEAAAMMDRAGYSSSTLPATELGKAAAAAAQPIAMSLTGDLGKTTKKKKGEGKRKASVFDEDEDDDENADHDNHRVGGDDQNKPAASDFKGGLEKDEEEEHLKPPAMESSQKCESANENETDDGSRSRSREHEKRRKQKDDYDDDDDYKDGLRNVRKEHWLRRDILVRIVAPSSSFTGRKAVVTRVEKDKFTARVEVLATGPDRDDGGDILKVDQDDLETVVPPKVGKLVRILNGRGRAEEAEIIRLDDKKQRATLRVLLGDDTDVVLENVSFCDFSKQMAS